MKFTQMPYTRPDYKAVIKAQKEIAKNIKDATSFSEIEKNMTKYAGIKIDYDTQSTLAFIRNSVDTRDQQYKEEVNISAEMSPEVGESAVEIYRALLGSPFKNQIEEKYGSVFLINAEMQDKLMKPEVLPLLTEEAKLCIEYDELRGKAQIEFDGKTLNLSQLGVYKESRERAVRRAVFEAEAGYYTENKEKYESIFSALVDVRTRIAKVLGYTSYTPVGYLGMARNCYDEKDVKTFRDQVKSTLVPLVEKLKAEQAARLGVDKLCIYDDTVLFTEGNAKPVGSEEDTFNAGVDMYRKMNADTRKFIDKMVDSECFDLTAKHGKTAGGYCTALPKYDVPFIFANFNGTAGDVEVFTHEGGHAYAAYLASGIELPENQSPSMESCEVHSMSMEFLCWKYLDMFYGENTDRAKQAHLLKSLFFIPYGCMVDEFQHHVYDNPSMSAGERNELWARLESEYRPYISMDDLPFYGEGALWQRQMHIYTSPFYYIDYCLAQTIALQIFEIMQLQSWDAAYSHYMNFAKWGGQDTFVGLLKKGGLKSPFEPHSLDGTIKAVENYMAKA